MIVRLLALSLTYSVTFPRRELTGLFSLLSQNPLLSRQSAKETSGSEERSALRD